MITKLNMILNIARDVLFEFDEQGTYLNIWTSNESLLAKPKEEMLGMRIRDILTKKEAEFYEAKFKEVIATQNEIEVNYTVTTPNGPTHFTGSIIPLNFGNIKTVILYAKDITLEEKQKLTLANIGNIAKIGAWEYDIKSGAHSWTEQTYLIHQIPVGKKIDEESFLAIYDDKSRELFKTATKLCITQRKAYDLELTLKTSDIKKIVRVTGYPIVDDKNITVKLAGTVQDITEHKKLTKDFEDQKYRLNQIIEHVPGVIFQSRLLQSGEITISYMHKTIQKIFGFTADSIMQEPSLITSNIHPEDLSDYSEKVSKSAISDTTFDWTGRIFDKDRNIKWIHTQGTPKLNSKTGEVIWDGILFDITEKKKLEFSLELKQKSLNHQLKLASLGKLSSGIAHEINNPLAIVNNVLNRITKLSKKQENPVSEIETLIELALDATKRIETITKGLGIFSRADESTYELFNVTWAVGSTMRLLEELYRSESFLVEFESPPTEHMIYGNRGRLDQALMNLVSNAADAIKVKEDGRLKVSLYFDDTYCNLKVSDNGAGIPDEIKDKIFDPFFTTKEVGNGTGIGLSLVNSIVLEHHGSINVESSQEGTTFHIRIPKKKGY